MNRLQGLSLFALASLALPLHAQETRHDLRLAARPGSSIWFEHEMVQSQQIDMGIQQAATRNVICLAVSLTVKEVTEDGATLVEATIERSRGTFAMPMLGEFRFDSIDLAPLADGEDQPPAEDAGLFGMPDFDAITAAAARIAGTKLVARCDAQGKVTSLDGGEDAWGLVQKRAGEVGTGMLTPFLSPNALEGVVRSAFGGRPPRPLAIGETWGDDKESDPKAGGLSRKLTMTLARASDESFEIAGAGTIDVAEGEAPAEGGEETESEKMAREMRENMKIENGRITGRTVISRRDGFVLEAEKTMTMDMTMPGPMGEDISVKHRSEIHVRRTTRATSMKKDDGEAKPDGAKKEGDGGE